MSISSISNVSSYQANQVSWQNNLTQRQSAFQALASALQANNLSDAQKAFAALQPNSSATTQTQTAQQGSVQNTLAADFTALGNALNAGDLKTAQIAFAKLQADMQSVKGHHRHHHKASASTQSTASTTSTPSIGLTAGNSGVTQNGFASGSINISV
jgi:hypothetical protein